MPNKSTKTTIGVEKTTRGNIETFRVHPRETVDDILTRLIIKLNRAEK